MQRVVDDVFGIITFVTNDSGRTLTHNECLSQLVQHDLVRRTALNQLVETPTQEREAAEPPTETRPATHALSQTSQSGSDGGSDLYDDYDGEDGEDDEERTEYEATLAYGMPAPFGTTRLEDDSDVMTEISSVMLTPLTTVQVLASA